MLHAAHVFETAILILAAFLIGCAIGYAARRLLMPKLAVAAASDAEAATAAPTAPLVVAPTIAPVAGARPRRSPAERLAAAAGRSPPADLPPADVAVKSAGGPSAEIVSLPPGQASAALLAMMGAEPETEVPQSPPGETSATHEALNAAGQDDIVPDAVLDAPLIEPARVAGEAMTVTAAPAGATKEGVAGVDAPARDESPPSPVPIVVVAREEEAVRLEDVPEIDEAAHVVDGAATTIDDADGSAEPSAASHPADTETGPQPDAVSGSDGVVTPPAEKQPAVAEDTEAAAMRAIEGGWTPPPAQRPPRRPVPHPEFTGSEVDTAMAQARTAVAAATAAADAAIASATGANAPTDETRGVRFEVAGETVVEDFLQADSPAPATDGLDFEPPGQRAFGKPDGLAEPRGGAKDDLKQIRGVTPQMEQGLNGLGIYHLDQIAGWDQKAVVWVDRHLGLKGRVAREKWVEQARALTGGHGQPARPVRR